MYTDKYDLDIFRNTEYRLMSYINMFYEENYTCLDLGCGSCRKLMPILPHVNRYYVVDYDEKRILAAKKRCVGFDNIEYIVADNTNLPLENDSCDLVSCFMTNYTIDEVCRVLRKGGIFILETLGGEDKLEIRRALGQDENGWRSSLLNESKEERKRRILHEFSKFFEIEMFKDMHFKTSIQLAHVIELFQMTNEIRDFCPQNEYLILEHLADDNGNITFWENRLIFVGKAMENPK